MIDLTQVRGVAQRLREDGYNDYCGDVGADTIVSLMAEIERLRQENELLWKEREEPNKTIALYVSECNRLEKELAEENAKLHEMSRLVDFSTQTAENILEKYAEIDAENKRLKEASDFDQAEYKRLREELRTQLATEQAKVRELVDALQRVKRHIPVGSAAWEFADIAIAKYGENK